MPHSGRRYKMAAARRVRMDGCYCVFVLVLVEIKWLAVSVLLAPPALTR